MLVKWILCRVSPADRGRFSHAQQRWSGLAQQRGFRCQVGGVDERSPDTACVLGVWHSREAYSQFMGESHDALFAATGQAGTYRSISVANGDVLFRMPGAAGDTVDAFTTAQLLRVADCEVRPGHERHFRDAQQYVWAPGMAHADGMRGGLFADLGQRRYLVVTGWRDTASHERYRHDRLPALSAQAQTQRDVHQLTGHAIHIDTTWTISGQPG